MSRLESIAVRVESPPGELPLTQNTLPILHEIRHALQRLHQTGEPTVLDLRAIPFAPGDEQRLLERLGQGEIRVEMSALGESRIHESRFAGVWVVEHANPEGERVSLQIEIARIPAILLTPEADIESALTALTGALVDDAAEQ